MQEIWKDLIYQNKNYGDRFEVSNTGKIKNKLTGNILKLNPNKNGYLCVCVSLGSRHNFKMFVVHKAMAETFISNKDKTLVVNHIDGNKINNNIDNLEWCTNKENLNHAINIGLLKQSKGFDNPKSKLTKEQVSFIRENYQPRHNKYGARALGRKFNIDHTTILDIVNGVVYKI